MAKRNHTRDLRTPTTDDPAQRLTVSFYQEQNPDVFWIRLCGVGVARTGFTPDSLLRVRIMPGCLIITSN
ncbi:hypothetical protein [Collimonas sp.]|jgi:hypothetical protein|uniref:hypothetical protein n=1 Tax=Collimonas sp. TaxID=1963772 RepID=UPI002C8AD322|nr:hypothetical protein [Collimonas sp.]HWW99883.1 hypothetical protein [Collimonas sp.]